MSKNPSKQTPNRNKRDEVAGIIAQIKGVTPYYVRQVVAGKRNNEDILTAYIEYKQGKHLLIEAIEKAVPFEIFNPPYSENN